MKTLLEMTDIELVMEFQRGKENCFDELVKRHMEKATRLAFVTVGNYEEARDISQEAFIKTYRALKGFQFKSKFSTWFYRILMNTAKDHLRTKALKKMIGWKTREDMEVFFEKVADKSFSASYEILGQETEQKISEVMRGLPNKQKWVFTLRFLEEMSIDEISQVTGMAEGTVKATIHFAMQKFKEGLSSYLAEGRK